MHRLKRLLEFSHGHGSGNADIWKLRLDGTGKDFERLTTFNDIKGGKVSNPVVATNGEFMAFQAARAHEVAGVGYGILIYKFTSAVEKDQTILPGLKKK